MRYVDDEMTRACVVCSRVKPGRGYLDISPVDVMCLDCGRAVVAAMAQARRAHAKHTMEAGNAGHDEE